MSIPDKKSTLSRTGKWLALGAILFVCLAPGRYDQTVFSWFAGKLGGTSIELGVEIKPNPRSPTDHFGIMTITNLTDQSLMIQNVRINRRKDEGCSFNPKDALPLGGNPLLPPGGNILVATPGLMFGGCGTVYIVDVTTDKGAVALNFNWDR